jgi:hypothetical protein
MAIQEILKPIHNRCTLPALLGLLGETPSSSENDKAAQDLLNGIKDGSTPMMLLFIFNIKNDSVLVHPIEDPLTELLFDSKASRIGNIMIRIDTCGSNLDAVRKIVENHKPRSFDKDRHKNTNITKFTDGVNIEKEKELVPFVFVVCKNLSTNKTTGDKLTGNDFAVGYLDKAKVEKMDPSLIPLIQKFQ